jgi:hypothetical protein
MGHTHFKTFVVSELLAINHVRGTIASCFSIASMDEVDGVDVVDRVNLRMPPGIHAVHFVHTVHGPADNT